MIDSDDKAPEATVPLDPTVRSIADGFKLAIRELSHEDSHQTLRQLLKALWVIWSEGANSWLGRKLMAALAGGLFALALWLAGGGSWRK